jgi:integrase
LNEDSIRRSPPRRPLPCPFRDPILYVLPDLREQEGFAALAWEEFDFKERLWTAPAARMKAGKEHRVPLSDCAVAIVQELQTARLGDFVFPGQRAGKPLSNMAMLKLLDRIGRDDLTTHGFRFDVPRLGSRADQPPA